jgi:outer membrane protein assembly factor BamD
VAARSLLSEARSTLAKSEYIVGRFYLKRKRYDAAVARFRGVVEQYPEFDQQEELLFHMARALRMTDQGDEARVYLDKLVQEYPESDYAELARKELGSLELAVGGQAVQD